MKFAYKCSVDGIVFNNLINKIHGRFDILYFFYLLGDVRSIMNFNFYVLC